MIWETENHICFVHKYSGEEPGQWLPYFLESKLGKKYKVLVRKDDNFLVMSNTELEIKFSESYKECIGDVLVVGLGINLINDKISSLYKVKSVKTIEKYEDIITNTKVNHKVVLGDINTEEGLGKFDTIFIDSSEVIGRDLNQLLNSGGKVIGWTNAT